MYRLHLLTTKLPFLFLSAFIAAGTFAAQTATAQEPSQPPAAPAQTPIPVPPPIAPTPASAPDPSPFVQNAMATGSAAENGTSEKFYAEFTASETGEDSASSVTGWDATFNTAISKGEVSPAKPNAPMGLVKALSTEHPTNLMAQSMMYFGAGSAPNNSNCVGFNNAAPGSPSTSLTQRFAVCLGSNSAYLLNGGKTTPLNVPNATSFSSVTLWLRKNGNLSISMVQSGTNGAVTDTLTGVVPPPNLTNFEISGMSANDRQSGSRYAVSSDDNADRINMAFDGSEHPGGAAVLTTNTAGGVFALIPPDYKPDAANRAVIYLHGLNELGWSISCQAPYTGCNHGVATTALALMKAGYVVIGISNRDAACYGNQACVEDLRSALSEYQAKLAIGGGLYGFAESMGGFQMLNAIAQGVFQPRAMGACCLNTNLADDYFPNYKAPGSKKVARQAGSAKSLIDNAYKITPDNPYDTATTGYDPMLPTAEGAERLRAVPAMFWASNSDQAVNKQYNSDQYASMVNAAGGTVSVITCQGDHEDLSCFDPAALIAFFQQH